MSRIKGKRLTARQKKVLDKLGYNPEEYLYYRTEAESVLFVHRETEELLSIPTEKMEGRL